MTMNNEEKLEEMEKNFAELENKVKTLETEIKKNEEGDKIRHKEVQKLQAMSSYSSIFTPCAITVFPFLQRFFNKENKTYTDIVTDKVTDIVKDKVVDKVTDVANKTIVNEEKIDPVNNS